MLRSTSSEDGSKPQNQGFGSSSKNSALQSEVFGKLRGRPIRRPATRIPGRGRQHHQTIQDDNAVTQEKAMKGTTGEHVASANVAMIYKKNIVGYHTNNHCSGTISYTLQTH